MFDTLNGWLAAPPENLIYLVPTLAFLEACAGVGLFVSGVFLLSTSTLLYTSESASLYAILMLSFSGALLGDHSGFLVGRLMGERVWRVTWLKTRVEARAKIQTHLEKSSPIAICVGRLVPLLRSLTPIAAGVSGMSWRMFLACDVLACTIWATGLYLILTNLALVSL
ncbi:MAG: DedA family protein [Gammaproteobacteria bacterium]|nr:DedA family protein [Gammaproteobacteria bacterium]